MLSEHDRVVAAERAAELLQEARLEVMDLLLSFCYGVVRGKHTLTYLFEVLRLVSNARDRLNRDSWVRSVGPGKGGPMPYCGLFN